MPQSHRRLCMHKSFVDCIHCSAWKIAAYQAMLSLLFCVKDILLFSCISHKKDLLCVAFSACFFLFCSGFYESRLSFVDKLREATSVTASQRAIQYRRAINL